MNILFKINPKLLISILFVIFIILFYFLYIQFSIKDTQQQIDYGKSADIVNPKFVKQKNNKEQIEVIAKKASFLSETKMFLEGNVKYQSDEFTLESDNVSFDQISFDAISNDNTIFKSEKINITSEGFQILQKGTKITFSGKSRIEIQ